MYVKEDETQEWKTEVKDNLIVMASLGNLSAKHLKIKKMYIKPCEEDEK